MGAHVCHSAHNNGVIAGIDTCYIYLYLGYIQVPEGIGDGEIRHVENRRERFVCLALGVSICHVGLPGGNPPYVRMDE